MAITTRRCRGCATFYDKKLKECPDCGTCPWEFTGVGRRSQLSDHLNGMVANAERERAFERSLGRAR